MTSPELFAAVTVPPPVVMKQGLSFWRDSTVHPARGNSSLLTVIVSGVEIQDMVANGGNVYQVKVNTGENLIKDT